MRDSEFLPSSWLALAVLVALALTSPWVFGAVQPWAIAAVTWTALASGALAAELKVGLGSEPSSIDPHYHNLGPNNSLAESIFDRLINQDEKQRLKPGLHRGIGEFHLYGKQRQIRRRSNSWSNWPCHTRSVLALAQ